MSSFNRNLIRIVVVVIVVFIAIPYMLPEMREDRYNPNPFAAAETAPKKGYFAKMIDKVLTFYGFKKKPKTAGLPAFNPNLPDNSTAPAAADTAPAPQSTAQAAAQRAHAERVAQLTGQNSAQGRAPNSEILETGGKKYEVITDIAGKKFVLTAQGPRPATEQELQLLSQGRAQARRQLIAAEAARAQSAKNAAVATTAAAAGAAGRGAAAQTASQSGRYESFEGGAAAGRRGGHERAFEQGPLNTKGDEAKEVTELARKKAEEQAQEQTLAARVARSISRPVMSQPIEDLRSLPLTPQGEEQENQARGPRVARLGENVEPAGGATIYVPDMSRGTSAAEPLINLADGNSGIIPTRPELQKEMNDLFRGGRSFSAVAADGNIIDNAYFFPNDVAEGPGTAFYKANKTPLQDGGHPEYSNMSKWTEADEVYTTAKENILPKVQQLGGVRYVVLDGGRSTEENRYHRNTVHQLFSGQGKDVSASNATFNPKSTGPTFVFGQSKRLESYRKEGHIPIEYPIIQTPSSIRNFSKAVEVGIDDMLKKQNQQKT